MIITISGQYGSGGDEVASRLAEILGYRIIDSKLVKKARELFTATYGSAEKPAPHFGSLHYSGDDLPRPGTAQERAESALYTDLIYLDAEFDDLGEDTDTIRKAVLDVQSKVVFEYAESGNCILLGKGSDFILRGYPDAIHVFSKADLDIRIERIMNLYNLHMGKIRGIGWMRPAYAVQEAGQYVNMERSAARELILNTDRRRRAYYEFITEEKWGDPKNFDFIISGNEQDIQNQTDLLLQFIRDR